MYYTDILTEQYSEGNKCLITHQTEALLDFENKRVEESRRVSEERKEGENQVELPSKFRTQHHASNS